MTEIKKSQDIEKKASSKIEKKEESTSKQLRNFSFSRPFIASVFLLAGIIGTLLTQSFAHKIDDKFAKKESVQDRQIKMLEAWQKEVNDWMKSFHDKEINRSDKFFDDFYSDNFDPFADIENIHRKMRERFSNFDKYFNDRFNGFNKKDYSRSSRTSISQKEDKDYIYYQLNFKGFEKDDISVKVKDRILSFAAKKVEDREIKDKNSESKSRTASNFTYSFFVPENVNIDNPEIIKQKTKIVVKFKKG